MFLRSIQRKKNDRIHRYFSVVENRCLAQDAGGLRRRRTRFPNLKSVPG
jgi:hypothetical protein